jgi:uncharacterized protein (DUF4415 family)
MRKRKPLVDEDGEVRELTLKDFKLFRPASEVLGPSLMAKLAAHRTSLQKAPTKEGVTIQLSRDVLDRFRATGEGWEIRLDAALREWADAHF